MSPEIRANTGLRIALRMTDATESSDVLGSTDAALIDRSTPGRAVVRTGSTLAAVQVGWVGVSEPAVPPAVEVVALDSWAIP